MILEVGKLYELCGTSPVPLYVEAVETKQIHELFRGDIIVPVDIVKDGSTPNYVETGWTFYRVLLTTGVLCNSIFNDLWDEKPAAQVYFKKLQ
jgi:hypothetical protein